MTIESIESGQPSVYWMGAIYKDKTTFLRVLYFISHDKKCYQKACAEKPKLLAQEYFTQVKVKAFERRRKKIQVDSLDCDLGPLLQLCPENTIRIVFLYKADQEPPPINKNLCSDSPPELVYARKSYKGCANLPKKGLILPNYMLAQPANIFKLTCMTWRQWRSRCWGQHPGYWPNLQTMLRGYQRKY